MARRRHRETALSVFGRRVRQLRDEKGWSQERLAEKADLDRSYIAGIEVGRRNPSLNALATLATGLGMGLSDLFNGVPAIAKPRAGTGATSKATRTLTARRKR